MKFSGISGNFADAKVEALAVPIFKGEKFNTGVLKDLDDLTGGLITDVVKLENFKGNSGQCVFIRFTPKSSGKVSRLLLVGVGEKNDHNLS